MSGYQGCGDRSFRFYESRKIETKSTTMNVCLYCPSEERPRRCVYRCRAPRGRAQEARIAVPRYWQHSSALGSGASGSTLGGGARTEEETRPETPKRQGPCGKTLMNRITPEDSSEIGRRSKQREARLRRKYPEVHGKVVDFISHNIDDGTLYFIVQFCGQDELLPPLRLGDDHRQRGPQRLERRELQLHSRVYEADSDIGTPSRTQAPPQGSQRLRVISSKTLKAIKEGWISGSFSTREQTSGVTPQGSCAKFEGRAAQPCTRRVLQLG